MRTRFAVVFFVLVYMVAFGLLARLTANAEFAFYGLAMIAIILGVAAVDRHVRFSSTVLWGLAAWGALHMGGGTLPLPSIRSDGSLNLDLSRALYDLWIVPQMLKYDQFVHAFGFGFATAACWQALRHLSGNALKPSLGAAILVVCAGMGLGALNEVLEFFATLTIPRTNVGGYENTGWDLVYNLYGCLVAVALIAFSHPDRTEPDAGSEYDPEEDP